jgi:hypothetical protein
MSRSSVLPDLKHGATRRRVQFLLDHVDLSQRYTLREIALLCGQPNKPLGKALRRLCFYQLVTVADRKRGGTNWYRPHSQSLRELQLALENHHAQEGAATPT